MKVNIKVKITRCRENRWWYKYNIGEIYQIGHIDSVKTSGVRDGDISRNVYFLETINGTITIGSSFIEIYDAIIIEEQEFMEEEIIDLNDKSIIFI